MACACKKNSVSTPVRTVTKNTFSNSRSRSSQSRRVVRREIR